MISIIIPAYNIAPYLTRCLDSLIAQSYSALEIIVVNDGSTDSTASIIDEYAARDRRIIAIHKENGGVSSARLAGIAVSSGEWIGFVDGDDYVEPEMFAHLLKNAIEHDADISHCGYQMVFPSRVDYYYNTGKLLEQDHETGLRDLIEGRFIEPGLVIKLYRHTLFDGLAERMDFSVKTNEDVLMNYWLFKASRKSVFEDICPYHYVLRPGSAATSKLNLNKLRDPLKVTKAIYADAAENLRPTVLSRMTRQLISGASMDASVQPDLVKPYRSECRKELRQLLDAILHCKACGTKLKLMALITTICPWGYSLVHKFYANITGMDRKYEIS